MSDLALKIIAQEKKEKTGKLDLSKCSLKEIPLEVFELNWLTSLNIIQNQISNLENLPVGLTTLYISNNIIRKLENLPEGLTELYAGYNKIHYLENLPKGLNYLDIMNNEIRKLENLPKELITLHISSNQIRNLENLPEKLTSLDIRSNQICKLEKLPEGLRSLVIFSNQIQKLENLPKGLKSLDISSNQIRKLENLPEGLSSLDIRSNQIQKLENLPEGLMSFNISYNNIHKIVSLTGEITSLFISYNQISKLENLPEKLVSLDISYNQISKLENLPQEITKLDIRSNQIRRLENLPEGLNSLNISNNKIIDLIYLKDKIMSGQLNIVWKPEFEKNELVLENNPLVTPPPEVINKGRLSVINYFKEIEKQGASYLYEAKVLVVGDARVGKTTLCSKLWNIYAPLPLEGDSTKGIDIYQMNFNIDDKILNANIWDFGGQQIYHSTHQFFLTKRSLYIFVDDNSRDDIEYDYWFQIIELLSKSSPVIVVQNKKANRQKPFDDRGFKSRFKNLKETFSINLSLENETDIKEFERLKNSIQYELSKLPQIGQKLPKQWIEIRKLIGELAKSKPIISLKEYYQICAKHQITETERALELSSYFHDLGLFLHFQDDDLLRKVIIIQKEWVTNAVYKIFDNKNVAKNFGKFTKSDAIDIWRESDYKEMYPEVLSLMKTFELIYAMPETGENEFLIPKLLPIEQPLFEWNYQNNIQMRYEYDFMPKGLISRFIVRQYRYIADLSLTWRKGVILERNDSQALIVESYIEKKIEIRVNGTFSRDLMTIIKDEFDRLHEQFDGLKVHRLIPCNCRTCNKISEPHFYDYDSLLRRIKNNKETVECDISYEDISVKGLVGGILTENVTFSFEENNIDFDVEATIFNKIYIYSIAKNSILKEQLKGDWKKIKNFDLEITDNSEDADFFIFDFLSYDPIDSIFERVTSLLIKNNQYLRLYRLVKKSKKPYIIIKNPKDNFSFLEISDDTIDFYKDNQTYTLEKLNYWLISFNKSKV